MSNGDFVTDKKANVELWDDVDNCVSACISKIASMVGGNVPEIMELEVTKPVVEVLVEQLESIGIIVPYVDGEY